MDSLRDIKSEDNVWLVSIVKLDLSLLFSAIGKFCLVLNMNLTKKYLIKKREVYIKKIDTSMQRLANDNRANI